MVKSLIIETSSERGLTAILEDDRVLFLKEFPFGLTNAKYLLPAIDEALKITGMPLNGLSRIVVGTGPGSYTGVRVGVITAKTLSFAAKIPVDEVCSLKGFMPDCDGPFAVLADAKVSGAYVALGEFKAGKVQFVGEALACPLEALQERLIGIRTIVTPNAGRLRPLVDPGGRFEWLERGPSAVLLGRGRSVKDEG